MREENKLEANLNLRQPPADYLLETYADRDRLYNQFELFRDIFNEGFDQALLLGSLSINPETAEWRMLDVASGEGIYTAEVFRRYPHSQIVGFDRDAEAIMTANMTFAREHIRFYVHDVHEAPPVEFAPEGHSAPEGTFDIALLWFALTHFQDAQTALKNAGALLKPGGVIILYDPLKNCFLFPHPSVEALAEAVNKAWMNFGTFSAGDRHTDELAKAGFGEIHTTPQQIQIGGTSAYGWHMLNLMIETMVSMRRSLVYGAKVIEGDVFDNYIDRLKADSNPSLKGHWCFNLTIARKLPQAE